eukprot:2231321-Ditylum_brightwellii.AAC.2
MATRPNMGSKGKICTETKVHMKSHVRSTESKSSNKTKDEPETTDAIDEPSELKPKAITDNTREQGSCTMDKLKVSEKNSKKFGNKIRNWIIFVK